MDSSLLLMPDVLSDSDDDRMWSPSLYVMKLSRRVRSGGSENEDDRGSVMDIVRFGGDGAAASGVCA